MLVQKGIFFLNFPFVFFIENIEIQHPFMIKKKKKTPLEQISHKKIPEHNKG